jgi:hypothetical protein
MEAVEPRNAAQSPAVRSGRSHVHDESLLDFLQIHFDFPPRSPISAVTAAAMPRMAAASSAPSCAPAPASRARASVSRTAEVGTPASRTGNTYPLGPAAKGVPAAASDSTGATLRCEGRFHKCEMKFKEKKKKKRKKKNPTAPLAADRVEHDRGLARGADLFPGPVLHLALEPAERRGHCGLGEPPGEVWGVTQGLARALALVGRHGVHGVADECHPQREEPPRCGADGCRSLHGGCGWRLGSGCPQRRVIGAACG